jgi:WD40 repeat protein
MRLALLELGSHCTAALFAGDSPLFALADGTVHRWTGTDQSARAHSALLAAVPAADGAALLTSGEDGRVCRTDGSGEPHEVAAVPRKWIGCVASGARGALAFAAGRSVWVQQGCDGLKELQHPRSVAGIAFAPDGSRVAVSRYNGVTIHTIAGSDPPVELEWKGIYAGVGFSPDGQFLIAAMQENLLHGWHLADRRHFRMTGYPARVKDWSWSANGRWLATSGAGAAVVWPFDGPAGPMGRVALELGSLRGEALVTAVACHPVQDAVAIGYSDGALAVAAIDADEQCIVRESGRGAISSISWHNEGARLAFGTELGECGILEAAP